MKQVLTFLFALALAGGSAAASDLDRQKVAADSKWLIHANVDAFRQTQVGKFVLDKIAASKSIPLGHDTQISVREILQKIHGITAFGTDYENEPDKNGALLIFAEPEIEQIVSGLLVQQSHAGGDITKFTASSQEIYSIKNDVFVSVQPGVIALSKNSARLEKALEVLGGKQANLAASETLAFANPGSSFFVVALAEGFNNSAKIHPQARILQEASGARLALGEQQDKLELEVQLRTKSVETSRQIEQVVRGALALLSLTQSTNQDLLALGNSAQISSATDNVTLRLSYPIAKALEKITLIAPVTH